VTTAATVAGHRALSVRLLMPWVGPWVAEIDLDPEDVALVPTSGKVPIQIGDSVTLLGTIDPRGSGAFVASTKLRVVGGGGGWDKPVKPQHWHAAGGVTSTLVYQATAATVGETVVDLAPVSLGPDFVRSGGPASRVFGDALTWWVDVSGVTQVGARPSASADASLEILEWDPTTQRAEVTCDALILPGTVLTDKRLSVSPVVRDVEQTFSHGGSRASVWCATATPTAGRLAMALRNLVREAGRTDYLRVYRYRFIEERGGGLALQAVDRALGFPDVIPAPVWTGVPGGTGKLAPSTEVLVEFVDGDPRQPIVRGFSTVALPLEATLDATTSVHVAPSAGALDLAGGGHPVALADKILAELANVAAGIASAGGSYTPPTSPSALGSTKVTSA